MFREKALVSGCQGPSIKVGAIMTSPTHIVYCDKTFVTIMFLSFIGGVRRRQTSLANEAATNKSFVETSTKMKRDYVDSDSDDDDAKRFDTPPQTSARKKRRGVIEKRRRDRINNSLSELRRMIPTASEKHGSSKLEKAEILQLTVEHLKTLQSAISKGYFPFMDVRTMAVDYRSFGFRECVSEVARYMISMDGIQSSVRDNLLSHLQNVMTHKPTDDFKHRRIGKGWEYSAGRWRPQPRRLLRRSPKCKEHLPTMGGGTELVINEPNPPGFEPSWRKLKWGLGGIPWLI
ncbi:uncharacterized protein LOC778639 isoform X2 [Ciona intestinalis]